MVMQPNSFGGVLDAIDAMPLEQQEEIVDIIRHRLRERERERLLATVFEAEAEFARGEGKIASVEEIMRECQP